MQVESESSSGPLADSRSDEAPTQIIRPDEDVVPAPRLSPDDLLKATLLAGSGGKIGRFHVLRLLGEGGMGMVFAAFDDELDRKIAIKLLRKLASEDTVGRARLLREAQTLARLSHPNVVTVYEVGEFGRQVYVAMEFVLGQTLQAWLQAQRRSWREVVRVFAEAGRGLAVAHAAGILHRDFKPANVLLGDDGRVRVVDFGLALAQDPAGGPPDVAATHVRLGGLELAIDSQSRRTEELTEAGSILGTPAYMAPERFTFDRTVDPRSDQFSFCVALYEGLYGGRPFPGRTYDEVRAAVLGGEVVEPRGPHAVPGWLRKVVLRGLAPEPAERFSDMNALLTAMQRDPQRARARVFAGLAAAAVLITGGYALAQATGDDGGVVCPDARAKLRPVWDDHREDVERALLATQAVYAADTWTRVATRLDQHADDWAAAHHDACEAHTRGEQSAILLDLRMACLERRSSELGALVTRLQGADKDTVRAAASAVDGLVPAERCADTTALATAVPGPEDPAAAARFAALRARLVEARAALSTVKLAEAATIADEVVRGAVGPEFRPLLAEAVAIRGRVEVGRGEYEPGRADHEEALWLADTVHDDVLLAEVMAELVHLLGIRLVRFDDALRWRRQSDAVVARLGETTTSHTALLRAFGVTVATQGRPLVARELLQRALAIDEGLPEPHEGNVIKDLVALGTAEYHAGNATGAVTYHQRALALGEQLYGPNHPEIARSATNLATAAANLGDLDRAAQLFERALAIIEATHGPSSPECAGTVANLGSLYAMREQYDRAQPLMERALAIVEPTLGPNHPDVATTVHNLAILAAHNADLPGARAYHQRALAIRQHNFPPDSPQVAESIAELGALAYREGDLPAAIRDLERAIAVFVANPTHIYKESLPRTRFNLARALRDAGKPEPAATEARRAAAEFRAVDATRYVNELAEIDAWLAKPPAKTR